MFLEKKLDDQRRLKCVYEYTCTRTVNRYKMGRQNIKMNRLKKDNLYVTSCFDVDSEFNKTNWTGGGTPG